MVTSMFGKPTPYGWCLMGAVVITNEMDVEIGGHGCVNGIEKLLEFLGPVTAIALADDLARSHIQCGKQRGRPVADVVMSALFRITETHGQKRLGAVEGSYDRKLCSGMR